jgi:hypothetical protein
MLVTAGFGIGCHAYEALVPALQTIDLPSLVCTLQCLHQVLLTLHLAILLACVHTCEVNNIAYVKISYMYR